MHGRFPIFLGGRAPGLPPKVYAYAKPYYRHCFESEDHFYSAYLVGLDLNIL